MHCWSSQAHKWHFHKGPLWNYVALPDSVVLSWSLLGSASPSPAQIRCQLRIQPSQPVRDQVINAQRWAAQTKGQIHKVQSKGQIHKVHQGQYISTNLELGRKSPQSLEILPFQPCTLLPLSDVGSCNITLWTIHWLPGQSTHVLWPFQAMCIMGLLCSFFFIVASIITTSVIWTFSNPWCYECCSASFFLFFPVVSCLCQRQGIHFSSQFLSATCSFQLSPHSSHPLTRRIPPTTVQQASVKIQYFQPEGKLYEPAQVKVWGGEARKETIGDKHHTSGLQHNAPVAKETRCHKRMEKKENQDERSGKWHQDCPWLQQVKAGHKGKVMKRSRKWCDVKHCWRPGPICGMELGERTMN